MTCPAEWTLSVYGVGELGEWVGRSLEAHLIRCADCRARILALREEAEVLGDALLERERAPTRLPERQPAAAAARGLALGGMPALAAAVLVLAVVGWLLESRVLPAAVGWLNPLRAQGVTSMVFDLVFALRNEAPELLALGVSVAATLSVSALLTFAVTALTRRWIGPGALVLVACALLPATPSEAHFGLHEHEEFVLPENEVHEGSLILWGETVNIDGVVDGDVIVGSDRLTVRGRIRGNLLAFAGNAVVDGEVEGAVWCLCNQSRVRGGVESDLYAFTHDLELGPQAQVGRNAAAVVDTAVLEGSIARDLMIYANRTELRGSVGRHVEALADRLAVRDTASIAGNLTAFVEEGRENEAVEIAPGATVGGETQTRTLERRGKRWLSRYAEPGFYLFLAIELAAAFLVGMVLHRFFPGLFGSALATSGEFFRTLGLGFVAVVAVPIALLVLAATLLGIPLALMGLGAFLASLYLSSIVVAALVGGAIVSRHGGGSTGFGLSLLVGLLVLLVLGHLPLLGIPVHLVVILTGVGLIVDRAWAAWWPEHRATVGGWAGARGGS